jgi:hypothetical protein
MGEYKLAYDEQITNFILAIFNWKSALGVYGEYVKKREKPGKPTYLHLFYTLDSR